MAVNGISDTTASPFVTLVSADGFEFHIRRTAACISGTIRRMLESGMLYYTLWERVSSLYLRYG